MRCGKRHRFPKRRHVGSHVIEPNRLGVRFVGLTAREKQNVCLYTLRIEDAGRQPKNRVEVAKLHKPSTQGSTGPISKKDVVGHDNSRSPAWLQSSYDMFKEWHR